MLYNKKILIEMNYKRLEMYLWWTCNNKCLFCIEMETMDKMWNVKVSESEILKKLIKYKKQWYNHVTYLWWEPFIQQNFLFALKVWKKLWYTIMVTTNASMIQYDDLAIKQLPYIDELVISIPIIDKNLQPIINNTKSLIDFDDVFINIKKYWRGSFLKVNTVLNPLNIDCIYPIVEFLNKYEVKELSFTYPDIDTHKYSKEHIIKYLIMPYNEVMEKIDSSFKLAINSWIRTKITDVPFCFLPNESWIKYTDDYDYQGRTKIMHHWGIFKRKWREERELNIKEILDKNDDGDEKEKINPRMRKYVKECNKCKYIWTCWGIAECYDDFYKDMEIKPILKDRNNFD